VKKFWKPPCRRWVFSRRRNATEAPGDFVKILNKPRSEIGQAPAEKMAFEKNRAARAVTTGSAGNLLAIAPHDRYK